MECFNTTLIPSRYSIEVSNQSDRFAIDSTTGLLSITDSLDRDTDPIIRLSVLATDSGTPPLSSSILISITLTDINDIIPTFSAVLFQLNITEDAANGSLVYQFVAVDNDEGSNGTVRQVYFIFIFCFFRKWLLELFGVYTPLLLNNSLQTV